MSRQQQLRAIIDRMVEDSIRRILPQVMNEVLVRTIANSGVITEARPRPAIPKASQRPAAITRRFSDLSELLDESVGADSYAEWERASTARPGMPRAPEPRFETADEPKPAAMSERLAGLDPTLRAMAEDMRFDDDGPGEMWGDDEHDSTSAVPDLPPVRDIDSAAKSIGIDFTHLARTINKTAPVVKQTQQDVQARAQFEERRLKALRERLDGGKPTG